VKKIRNCFYISLFSDNQFTQFRII